MVYPRILISDCVLLKLLMFTPILFLNLLNIFITNAVNSFSGILFIFVSVFFSHFLLLFHLENIFSAFSLFNFVCLYECRWSNYLLWSSTGVLMWECFYTDWRTLIMQSHAAVSCGRAGFDVNGSHILSQCLLASISLIGGQAGAGVVRTGSRC